MNLFLKNFAMGVILFSTERCADVTTIHASPSFDSLARKGTK